MKNIDKPSPSLEKSLQKYFKVLALVIMLVILWRFFTASGPAVITEATTSFDDVAIRGAVSAALNDALDQRQFSFAPAESPLIKDNGKGYIIFVPYASIPQGADAISVNNDAVKAVINFSSIAASQAQQKDTESEKSAEKNINTPDDAASKQKPSSSSQDPAQ